MANISLETGQTSGAITKIVLGDVATQVRQSAMPAELAGTTPFIGLEDITSFEGTIGNLAQVSGVRSRVVLFKAGDVLYGRLRPYLRKIAVAECDGAASSEILVIRCSERISPQYLQLALLSEDFNQYIALRTKGDRPRASYENIAQYSIDLPSLDQQEEICLRHGLLGASISRMIDAQAELERLGKVLFDTVGERLIWQSGAKSVTMADLIESIDYGTAQKSGYDIEGTPVLRIPNITAFGTIDTADLKYTRMTKKDVDRYLLKRDDILVIRSNGSLALVGKAAKVTSELVGFAFAGYLLRLRPKTLVSADYLMQLIASRRFQKMIESSARSSSGINNLSASRLGDFKVPFHDAQHQEKITKTLTALKNSISSASANLTQSLDRAKRILERARGDWLGQTSSSNTPAGFSDNITTERRHRKNGGLTEMDEDIETAFLRRLDAVPTGSESFSAIYATMRADYDAVRDAVFGMLRSKPAKLVQYFDEKTESIKLRRAP